MLSKQANLIVKLFILLTSVVSGVPKTSAQLAQEQRILRVGPGQTFSTPSKAAAIARDHDLIEIMPGTYGGDVAVWSADNITLRGVGERPHMRADGASAQGKAIWVITGDNVIVENIEFSGATVPDRNGAGIRYEGTSLVVRNCYFHDNQMGILTSNNPNSEVTIDSSEFANSHGGSISHNIYIGRIRSFTLQFSYSHHATIGHNVKSRAATNYILYNRLMDEKDGRSSYAIDLPEGGR
jgi:pectate lyase